MDNAQAGRSIVIGSPERSSLLRHAYRQSNNEKKLSRRELLAEKKIRRSISARGSLEHLFELATREELDPELVDDKSPKPEVDRDILQLQNSAFGAARNHKRNHSSSYGRNLVAKPDSKGGSVIVRPTAPPQTSLLRKRNSEFKPAETRLRDYSEKETKKDENSNSEEEEERESLKEKLPKPSERSKSNTCPDLLQEILDAKKEERASQDNRGNEARDHVSGNEKEEKPEAPLPSSNESKDQSKEKLKKKKAGKLLKKGKYSDGEQKESTNQEQLSQQIEKEPTERKQVQDLFSFEKKGQKPRPNSTSEKDRNAIMGYNVSGKLRKRDTLSTKNDFLFSSQQLVALANYICTSGPRLSVHHSSILSYLKVTHFATRNVV